MTTLRNELRHCLLANLRFVLARQPRGTAFIDTKLDLATGRNFSVTDPMRGSGVIYNWIQGRGIEALAQHGQWLRSNANAADAPTLIAHIQDILPKVIAAMETIRLRHGGHLPFRMKPDGDLIDPAITPSHSLSDLFYAKGLLAAGNFLNDTALIAQATCALRTIFQAIRAGTFQLNQVALDPKNPVGAVPGRHSHAGRLIALSATPLLYRTHQRAEDRKTSLEFIQHILAHHSDPDTGDFWEFHDAKGQPWHDTNGALWSDPGHANEFVGLALENLHAHSNPDPQLTARLQQILVRNFANGFTGIGLVKAYDIAARRPINDDMPWWSLPETMRAAALVLAMTPESVIQRDQLQAILQRCWHAYRTYYVRPEQGLMAVPCLDAQGHVSASIPATPDADPCYHTGLSLIGCLQVLSTSG